MQLISLCINNIYDIMNIQKIKFFFSNSCFKFSIAQYPHLLLAMHKKLLQRLAITNQDPPHLCIVDSFTWQWKHIKDDEHCVFILLIKSCIIFWSHCNPINDRNSWKFSIFLTKQPPFNLDLFKFQLLLMAKWLVVHQLYKFQRKRSLKRKVVK